MASARLLQLLVYNVHAQTERTSSQSRMYLNEGRLALNTTLANKQHTEREQKSNEVLEQHTRCLIIPMITIKNRPIRINLHR